MRAPSEAGARSQPPSKGSSARSHSPPRSPSQSPPRSPPSRAASRPRSRVAISEKAVPDFQGTVTLPPILTIPPPPKRPPRPPTPEWLLRHSFVGFCRKCQRIHGAVQELPPQPRVLYRRSVSDPLLPKYLGPRSRLHTSLPPIDRQASLSWKARQEAAEAEAERLLAVAEGGRAAVDAEVAIKRALMARDGPGIYASRRPRPIEDAVAQDRADLLSLMMAQHTGAIRSRRRDGGRAATGGHDAGDAADGGVGDPVPSPTSLVQSRRNRGLPASMSGGGAAANAQGRTGDGGARAEGGAGEGGAGEGGATEAAAGGGDDDVSAIGASSELAAVAAALPVGLGDAQSLPTYD